MKLKKEPKHIDFVIESESWSDKDLADFRSLMLTLKKQHVKSKPKNIHQTSGLSISLK